MGSFIIYVFATRSVTEPSEAKESRGHVKPAASATSDVRLRCLQARTPTSFHREVPSSPQLPSHSIPPGCPGDEFFREDLHLPFGRRHIHPKGLIWGAQQTGASSCACPRRVSGQGVSGGLGRAPSPPLRSHVGDGAALPPSPASSGGFATERTTEKLFAGARRLFQKSLISWAPKYVTTLKRGNKELLFCCCFLGFSTSFLFSPENLRPTHFRAHSQRAGFESL